MHASLMGRLIDSIIDNHEQARWRSPSLEYIGEKELLNIIIINIYLYLAVSHAHLFKLGFTGDLWEVFGECLVDVFGMYEIVQVTIWRMFHFIK
jgi:hypothetical protein